MHDIIRDSRIHHPPFVSSCFHDFHIHHKTTSWCRCHLSECFPLDGKRKIWVNCILSARSHSREMNLILHLTHLGLKRHFPLFFRRSHFTVISSSLHISNLPDESLFHSRWMNERRGDERNPRLWKLRLFSSAGTVKPFCAVYCYINIYNEKKKQVIQR